MKNLDWVVAGILLLAIVGAVVLVVSSVLKGCEYSAITECTNAGKGNSPDECAKAIRGK